MGKYIGSPWGFVRGKIGDAVGGAWKGIDWVRVRVLPTQKGTLGKYRLFKDGLLPAEQFSFPQMNIRRAITQVLGYIARMNMPNWISLPWQALVDKRGWTVTATNAFVKRNAATLLSTMDRVLEFDELTNTPNLTKMLVSDGDLESGYNFAATYDATSGAIAASWDATTYTNGVSDDLAMLLIVKKPILESAGRDGTWYPQLFVYGILGTFPMAPKTRADAAMTATLPAGLDPANLTAYLFFRDSTLLIGYSKSLGAQVTAAI